VKSYIHYQKEGKSLQKAHITYWRLLLCHWILTRGGKIFSAARRGTENPPWVLVSLAVRVLQKNSVCGLFDFSARSDASNAFSSY